MALGKITNWWLGDDGKLHTYQSAAVITPPPPPVILAPKARAVITSQTNLAASFSAATTTKGTASIPAAGYAWDFGDGTTGSGITAAHTYAAPGTYTVKLTVTDSAGLSSQAPLLTVIASVPVVLAPTAGPLTWTPTAPGGTATGYGIDFDWSGSHTNQPGATITQSSISYGDGGADVFAGDTITSSHRYPAAGTYTAKLVITDSTGKTSTTTSSIGVTIANSLPTAKITQADVSGMTVTLSANGSFDPDAGDSIQRVDWNFGDGAGVQASGVQVSHTYGSLGPWVVTVAVYDKNGGADQTSVTVTPVAVNAQPAGADIVPIQNLGGATLTAKVNSAGASKKVSFPNGQFLWNDFNEGAPTANGGYGLFGNTVAGLIGTSRDGTVIGMNPGSSSKQTSGSTTKLEYVALGSNVHVVKGLTLLGQPTGPLAANSLSVYNGWFLSKIDGFLMEDVLVKNIPGSGHLPPYETFAIDGYYGSNHTFRRVEVDGGGIGGTAFGPNFHAGLLTIEDCNAHDNKWSAGVAIYRSTGSALINRFRSVNNYTGINFEQNADGYAVDVNSPTLDRGANGVQDVFIGSFTGSTKLTIRDPVDAAGNPRTTLLVACRATYGGQPNAQQRSDIKVLRNGVDVSSSIIRWI